MRKRIQKKSEVLREGYIKGLRKAHRIISEMVDSHQSHIDEVLANKNLSERTRAAIERTSANVEDALASMSVQEKDDAIRMIVTRFADNALMGDMGFPESENNAQQYWQLLKAMGMN